MSAPSERVWEGRGERGDQARMSIISGAAANDLRFTAIHFRIILHVGRFNHNKGWCRLSQTELADMFGVRRQAISKAGGELVKWGYIEKRSQQETGESFCQYRVVIDGGVSAKTDTPGVSARSDTSVCDTGHQCPPEADTSVSSEQTPVSALRTPNKRHSDISDKDNNPPAPQGGKRARSGLSDLPIDWALTPELKAWSLEKRPSHEALLDDEVEKFRGYWHGSGKRMKDWAATWRKWWLTACKLPVGDKGAIPAPSARAQKAAEFLQLSRQISEEAMR